MLEQDIHIVKKEFEEAIAALKLDLRGFVVLTEAATGLFVLTPLLALAAGADKVYALTAETKYGSVGDVTNHTRKTAELLGLDTARMEVLEKADFSAYAKADIVTNSGHVRPLDEKIIASLKPGAVISYMCEAWEHRAGDLDINACIRHGIRVCGLNESHPAVDCFRETGLIALRLILESMVSLDGAKVLILSRDRFGLEIKGRLEHYTDQVEIYKNFGSKAVPDELLDDLDLLVVADYLYEGIIVGGGGLVDPVKLKETSAHVKIIQYIGANNVSDIKRAGLAVYPDGDLPPVRMQRTLADISYRAGIRLFAGGLKVGELAACGTADTPEFRGLLQEMPLSG